MGWLSELRAWHDLHGAPWPSDSWKIRFPWISSCIAGAKRKRPMRNLNVQGHSFRIGGAVELLIAKTLPEVVAGLQLWEDGPRSLYIGAGLKKSFPCIS